MAYNEKSLKKEHRKQWRTSKLKFFKLGCIKCN